MLFFLIDCKPCKLSCILLKIIVFHVHRVEIRPENEYDKLLRLSNESYEDMTNDIRPCGGFSVRYECACDFFESQCHRSVQSVS